MRKMFLLGLFTLLVAATALTQSNTTPLTEQDKRDTVSSTFMTLNVIVTDRTGHYVEGLTPDQFEIYVDNVKQEFTHFATDDSPVSIGIVYEVNENETELLNGVLNALRQFVSTLESDDDFFFMTLNVIVTGTLTENEMTVRELWTSGLDYRVGGRGYEAFGKLESVGNGHDTMFAEELLRVAALCSDAHLVEQQHPRRNFKVIGDPTSGCS